MGVIFLEVGGSVSDEDLLSVLRRIGDDPRFSSDLRLLGDFTQVTDAGLSPDGMLRCSQLNAFSNDARRAIIVRSFAEFGMPRMYDVYCTLYHKSSPQIFKDREAAIEFLNHDCPSEQMIPLEGGAGAHRPVDTHSSQLDSALTNCEQPAFFVDGEVRVISANTAAGVLMGMSAAAMENQFCGDLLGCENARLPGGCGNSPFCESCHLLNIVRDCLEGCAKKGELVYRRKTGKGTELQHMAFLTERVRNLVLLRIDSPCSDLQHLSAEAR